MRIHVLRSGAYFHGLGVHMAACVTAGVGFALLVAARRASIGVGELVVLHELLAPLPAVVASASLLPADPSLGLVAATRTPLARILARRWVAALLVGSVPALALHAAVVWAVPGMALSPLAWLAPLLFLSALALAASAAFSNSFTGLGAAAAYWAASIVTVPALREACASPPGGLCLTGAWSTSFGLIAPDGGAWLFNRALLIAAAGGLAVLAASLYREPERHIAARARSGDEA